MLSWIQSYFVPSTWNPYECVWVIIYFTLKMEAIHSSETSVITFKSICRHNPSSSSTIIFSLVHDLKYKFTTQIHAVTLENEYRHKLENKSRKWEWSQHKHSFTVTVIASLVTRLRRLKDPWMQRNGTHVIGYVAARFISPGLAWSQSEERAYGILEEFQNEMLSKTSGPKRG
jgi:hypothetical protein